VHYGRDDRGILIRTDGEGDYWAYLHRHLLPKRYLMTDLDGWMVREEDLECRENTENLTFIEIVPDHQINALIREVYYVAIFDRKASQFAVNNSTKTLSWYLDLCRKVSQNQPLACRFIYVIGRQQPPWELREYDIYTGKFGEAIMLDGQRSTWLKIWEATGLTGTRTLFERELNTYGRNPPKA
jgi:hypothetical protein